MGCYSKMNHVDKKIKALNRLKDNGEHRPYMCDVEEVLEDYTRDELLLLIQQLVYLK